MSRTCVECGKSEPEVTFYRRHDVCRPCVRKKVEIGPVQPLAVRVEKHRQQKVVKNMLREELKRIAKARARSRIRTRKAKKQQELVKPLEGEAPITVTPAQKELARRTLSRRRLIEFIKEFHPRYKAGWVHYDICAKLEQFLHDVAEGKSPRLKILMPPRHGKSQIASKLFPAFGLGHYPFMEFIACSYNVSLALEFSREVRNVIRSDRYGILFPEAKLDPDFQSAEAWKLQSKTGVGSGGYVAAGIGGPITGKGAHILIIDDPIKNAEEAESLEHRQKIWDWYRSTAYTRLAPGGGVLVIQTCWHDDDLAGRLTEEARIDPEADQFVTVRYPAVAVEDEEFRSTGEALHTDRYDIDALMKIKRTVGPRYWAALYQQDPVPDEGAYFTKEMFRMRREGVDPKRCHIYQAWDFAISEKKHNDWNVGVTFLQDYEDNLHLVEVRRFKTSDSAKIVENMLDMYEHWAAKGKVIRVGVEDGQIWRAMNSILMKRCGERRVYPFFGDPLKPLTDKQVRARPLQARMQHGKVTFSNQAAWFDDVQKELLRFPSGTHDDIVDAMAWCVTILLGQAPPKMPRPAIGRREPTLKEAIAKATRGSGSISAMAA